MAYSRVLTNQRSSPRWAGDMLEPDLLMPAGGRVDVSAFSDALGVKVVLTADKAIGQTSLAVTALSAGIPAQKSLYFAAGKYARTTAAVAAGAVAIPVEALPVALVTGDTAVYSQFGRKDIPSGTLVSRTYAQRDAKTAFHPAVYTDDEFYLLAFDIISDGSAEEAVMDGVFVKPGKSVAVFENYLPDWATISANANLLAKLRAEYVCIVGVG